MLSELCVRKIPRTGVEAALREGGAEGGGSGGTEENWLLEVG